MANALVESLLKAGIYPKRTNGVSLVETHLSWVFLTDEFAYKLLKPVRFEFVDFSSVEQRRWGCDEEIRLNRRLAPNVYLQVVAVVRDAKGTICLDETADTSIAQAKKAETKQFEIIDWLVKMRRLPADRTLVALVESGQLRDEDLTGLASKLAKFYRRAAPITTEAQAYRHEVERHIRANRAELLGNSDPGGPNGNNSIRALTVKRVHAAQLQLLKLRPYMFDARVSAGRVVEGHGDLRPEHIYLVPEPVVIDCIEFSRQFRQLDVADELCFLVSECDFINAAAVGRRIAELCFAALHDAPPAELLAFYRCYRACVRAKVALLRSRQLDRKRGIAELSQATRHLDFANRYADELRSVLPPLLIVVYGLPGSGKTTLSQALAEQLGADVLSTDALRRQLLGASATPSEFNTGHYQRDKRLEIYRQLFQQADELLRHRVPVVLDGAFPWIAVRHEAANLAARRQSSALFVRAVCPEAVALERIAQRAASGNSFSEVRPELYAQQRAEAEPPTAELVNIDVDTTAPLAAQITAVLDALSAHNGGKANS